MNTKYSSILYAGIIGLSLIMVIAAYSNTLYCPPVLDDFHTFIDEPLVKIDTISISNFIKLAHTKFSYYRWIPMISFAIDLWIGKGDLSYFHFTNILIHCICLLLAICFVCQLGIVDRSTSHDQRNTLGPLQVGIIVACLWALNPVQTSAVTYLVQRMTSLSFMFFLMSMSCYVEGRRRAIQEKITDYKTSLFYCGSALATVMALLCKENSAMIPVAMILTEWWFFQPQLHHSIWGLCKRHSKLSIFVVLVALLVALKAIAFLLAGFEGRHFTATQRLMTEARIVVWYISVLLWPDPRRLSLEHHVELSMSLLQPVTTLLSIGFLVFMVLWIFWRRQKYRLLTYGLMWFLLNLLIESTIVPLELLFEHRMYLPSLGLFLALVAWGEQELVPRVLGFMKARDAAALTCCFVAIVSSLFSMSTFLRNEAWQNPVTLSADDVAKNPASPRARANYAVALSRTTRCDEAIENARKAIELGQKNYDAYGVAVNTIMICYQKMGEFERIINEAQAFIDEWPVNSDVYTKPSIYIQLAKAHQELGNIDESYKWIKNALSYNLSMTQQIPHVERICADELVKLFLKAKDRGIELPGMEVIAAKELNVKYWCAIQLIQTGYQAVGERILRQVATIDEVHAEAAKAILDQSRDFEQRNVIQSSKWSFVKKYLHNPFSQFNASMAIAYLVRQDNMPSWLSEIGEAFLDYALSLQPTSSDAHLLKGWYCFERNDVAEALAAANRAIELEPDYAKAWMGLGFFLTKGPRPVEAVSAFSKALELYPGYPHRRSIFGIIHSLQDDA